MDAPQLRPDGTLLYSAGYDGASALLFEPSADFPSVPARPSLEEARKAAADLLQPFSEFPLVSDCDRSALTDARSPSKTSIGRPPGLAGVFSIIGGTAPISTSFATRPWR